MGRDDQTNVLVGVALSLALTLGLAGVARAQPRAEARAHFEQGEAYFRAGGYDLAIVEYQAAYDLVPEPGLLFNIGLSCENAGDPERAIATYRRYLDADPRGGKAAEARARSEAISRGIAAARRAREIDAEVLAATIARRSAEEARRVDELKARQALRSRSRSITAGERVPRTVVVGAGPRLWPGLTVLGAAAACAGVGVFYGQQAAGIREELDQALIGGTPPLDSRDPRFDAGASAARRSAIFYGIAGTAAVLGGVLIARALIHDGGAGEVSLQATVGPGTTTLGLEGAW